jgi:hypothetical protein
MTECILFLIYMHQHPELVSVTAVRLTPACVLFQGPRNTGKVTEMLQPETHDTIAELTLKLRI